MRRSARTTLLGPFDVPGLPALAISSAASSFVRFVVQLTMSWITLELTGSPFWVGVVLAVRMAPQFLLGIPAGVVADRVPRHALIVAVNGLVVAIALSATGIAAAGTLTLAWVLVITFTFGALDTVRTSATQAYVFDLAHSSQAARALASTNLAAQLIGALGGAVAGVVLEQLGAAPSLLMVAAASLVAAGAMVWVPRGARHVSAERAAGPGVFHAMMLLGRNRLIAVLALAIVLAEIFGFSNNALQPTFARDVFDVGPSGLGTMAAARSIGGVVGLAVLARLGATDRAGSTFLLLSGGLGLALVGFAVTPLFEAALIFLALVGAAASVLDTLGQTLLQRSARDTERGAAMGIWVFSIGFGPIGLLAIGAAAETLGPRLAQGASGLILILITVALAMAVPVLWRSGRPTNVPGDRPDL